jgi:electron transfer flavoprotein alpha/beta subunit
MKIIVALKRVVDLNVNLRAKSDGSGVDMTNVKMSMNPFDEIAIEEAVRLRMRRHRSSAWPPTGWKLTCSLRCRNLCPIGH